MQATKGSARRDLPDHPVSLLSIIGREAKISLTLETVREVNFTLYNAVGQRVMAAAKKPQDGKVSFHISQSPGVYFYRIKAAKPDL